MVDSINGINNSNRLPVAAPNTAVRTVNTLNAVQQKSQKASGASAPVKVFAVAQSASSAATSNKVPRGSLVDVLA